MDYFEPQHESGLIERFEQAADRTRRLHRLRAMLGAEEAGRETLDEQIRRAETLLRSIGRQLRRSA